MLTLEKPALCHYRAVMKADQDFQDAGEQPYCGLKGRMGYIAWLTMVWRQAKPDAVEYGSNPNEIYFLLDEGQEICGFGQLRPIDTPDVLTWAGHIGYSVPPSRRGKGYAQYLLRQLLTMAFDRGMNEVLLTCDVDNDASRHIIEKAGGEFSGFYRTAQYYKRLYWFTKEERDDVEDGAGEMEKIPC